MTEAGQSRAKDDTYKSYNLYLMITLSLFSESQTGGDTCH